ncbi:NAD(P)/FAD-dependent oxidoreductase [Azotobacter armeniacus]
MTHRIVIVGGGAGGLELATRLGKSMGRNFQAKITLVDANMTHLWKPLLHEVAAGSLNSTGDELNYVAQAKWNNFEFQYGRMCGLDRTNKRIRLAALPALDDRAPLPERELSYDTLILSVGSTTNDFGTPGAAEHCIFLESRDQAERFRRLLLSHYLRAHASDASGHQVNVAIVGAGATGVELAAELRHASEQLVAYGLERIPPENLSITLIESSPRVLAALPERISRSAHATLESLGARVLTSTAVSEVTAEGLRTKDDQFIPADLMVWAAGVRAPAFLKDLDGLETNRINQLMVRPTLQTTLDDDIFAFGDCAACPQPGTDRTVPPRAQAAHQQASLLAKSLYRKLQEDKPLLEYRYSDHGSLISLSSFSAIGNLMGNLTGDVTLEGWLARKFYISLYRMHQMALYGTFRTLMMMLGDRFRSSTEPRLKLH